MNVISKAHIWLIRRIVNHFITQGPNHEDNLKMVYGVIWEQSREEFNEDSYTGLLTFLEECNHQGIMDAQTKYQENNYIMSATTDTNTINKILPYFTDTDNNTWDVLSIHFCIDFGGRQAQIECQRNNDDSTYPTKTFVIYGLSGEFSQHNSKELCNSSPLKGDFYIQMMSMFKTFDTATDPKFKVHTAGLNDVSAV